jgi:hypothetical protein
MTPALGEVAEQERGGEADVVRAVELRALVSSASQEEEGRLGAGPHERVVQRMALGAGGDPVAVAVGDQERWGGGAHPVQRAGQARGLLVGRYVVHTQQALLDRRGEQFLLQPGPERVGPQVALAEPGHDRLDVAGLVQSLADAALELVVAGV